MADRQSRKYQLTLNNPLDKQLDPDGISDIQGHTFTAPDGQQYFQIGRNRIKITEHFPVDGKQISDLIQELILIKSRDNCRKTA